MVQPGLFDMKDRYESLSKFGDPLEKLKEVVDFEIFRRDLEEGLGFSDRSSGGRPPYDAILIFKILVLQTLYSLSDDQTEYQIKDRLSFMRFLDLELCQNVPDAKTVWLYRERLSQKGLIEKLFSSFDQALKVRGYLAMNGQIVDASIISAPRQRMTKEEKETIKKGGIPEEWQANPAKLAQKDRDARWVVKYKKAKAKETDKLVDLATPYFGYKNHISMDNRYGFVRKFQTTDASQYDGKVLSQLLDKENTSSDVWGDTAYRSEENETLLYNNGFVSKLHRKKPKGKSMPLNTLRANGKKSKVRSRIEHVFAVQKEHMGIFIRTIGIKRANVKIALANIVYNMKRLIFWENKLVYVG
jgi:IS5 family transposase